MLSAIKTILGIAIVTGVVVAGVKMSASAKQAAKATAAAALATTPPPDAAYTDQSAETILREVTTAKKGVRDQVAASYQGLWVPDTGWEAEVVDVTSETGGTAVRMQQTSTAFIGGSFYIVTLCPTLDQEVKKGDRATVQGRIKSVDMLTGTATPIYRVLLHDGRVLKVDQRH